MTEASVRDDGKEEHQVLLPNTPRASLADRASLVNRDFKIQRRGRQQERQKIISLISKTTTLQVHHAFLYISLPALHDYDVKMPNFAFYGVRKQTTTKFCFSFCTWIWSLGIQLQEVRLHLTK